MTGYIVRRVLQAIPLLLLISLVAFMLMQAIPGGPLAAYESNPSITPADLERMRAELGLDVPKPIQYLNWLGAVVRGDWGESFMTGRPVVVEIGERLPNTLYLSLPAFLMALAISIPIGILSAVRQYSWFDHAMTLLAFIGHSIPVFWLGLVLIIVFNVLLKNPATGGPLLPGGGMLTIGAPPALADRLTHFLLPAAVLVFFNLATYVRYMRAGMLDALHQDYVRTAYAKGLSERGMLLRHALKNAALPLVTIIGLELPNLASGALVTEIIFSWPGMGRLFYDAVQRVDYSLMMGVLMLTATLIVTFGLITDIAYAYLDPRIRFE